MSQIYNFCFDHLIYVGILTLTSNSFCTFVKVSEILFKTEENGTVKKNDLFNFVKKLTKEYTKCHYNVSLHQN